LKLPHPNSNLNEGKLINTIGHSTRTLEYFLQMLDSFGIKFVADIRKYPGSTKYPQFNKDQLEYSLHEHKIAYRHFPDLGGRRKVSPNSKNTAWKNESFRAYADYMETPEFKKGINALEQAASNTTTAFMCSEAVWWRCHRSLVADYLKWKGWKVQHIMEVNKSTEHPFTKPASIINGTLDYSNS
jgi:uncharacterized protein (DUF488 family)